MGVYADNAEKYKAEIDRIKAEIDAYRLAHRRDDQRKVRNYLIPMERELIAIEIKLSNDYNAMHYKDKQETYEKLKGHQIMMQQDITRYQNDLLEMRKDYVEWFPKMLEEKYPKPRNDKANVEAIKETANCYFKLFHNAREILILQNKKISYCKNMNQYEVSEAKRLQERLRGYYAESFDRLFTYTETAIKEVGFREAKRLLEVRSDLIKHGQEDSLKNKGIITEKPPKLKEICDKAKRVKGCYKKGLDEQIENYRIFIEREEEMQKAEAEYYEELKNSNVDEEMELKQKEEENRYNSEWVIPDEEYKDEEGNIISNNKEEEDKDR